MVDAPRWRALDQDLLPTTSWEKVLVADAKVALLTSANFTDSGLADNIEVGMILHDFDEAGQLDPDYWLLDVNY